MSGSILQKQKTTEPQHAKCIKCKVKQATKEDQMCDSCRFMVTIDGILESRKT